MARTIFINEGDATNLRIRNNCGYKIGGNLENETLETDFDFTGWTGRAAIKYGATIVPCAVVIDIPNAEIWFIITHAIAAALPRAGMIYDLTIDSGEFSYSLMYGSISVDPGASAIP